MVDGFCYSPVQAMTAVRDAGTIVLWNVLSGEVAKRIDLPPCPPLIAFDNTGSCFAYAYGDSIKVDALQSDHSFRFSADEKRFVSMEFDRDNRLWTGMGDGSICSWNLDH